MSNLESVVVIRLVKIKNKFYDCSLKFFRVQENKKHVAVYKKIRATMLSVQSADPFIVDSGLFRFNFQF